MLGMRVLQKIPTFPSVFMLLGLQEGNRIIIRQEVIRECKQVDIHTERERDRKPIHTHWDSQKKNLPLQQFYR